MEPVRERSDFPVLWPVTTRWADNDIYGHVNNATYYAYFDSAVNGWLLQAVGKTIQELDAIGIVVRSDCQYLMSVAFPDDLEVGVAVTRLGRTSITYELGVFVAGQDRLHAIGTFVHVYVDRVLRRPVPIPDDIRAAAQGVAR